METFDRLQFIRALAEKLHAGDWTAKRLQSAIDAALKEQAIQAPALAQRLMAEFFETPSASDLRDFLAADVPLARALGAISLLHPRSAQSRTAACAPALKTLDLPELPTEAALAAWLGISVPRLQWLADITGRNRHHPQGGLWCYRHRWIPRGGRTPRLLEIPKRPLKALQRIILEEILNHVPAHAAAHGFTRGRSILTNAQPHCGKPIVLRFDLQDFFPRITSARVFHIFRTLGYPVSVSRLLTGLCTTRLPTDVWNARPGVQLGEDFEARQRLITRHLPQGAPTSPALANLAAHRLDRRLGGLARAIGATYTRYADDLTFSGSEEIARARTRLEPLVGAIAIEEGFNLNFRKTRLMRAGTRQHVTGVVVNILPNITRHEFDLLKAILTNCMRHGPQSQNRERVKDFRAHLAGRVAHASVIHPGHGVKLRKIFDRIPWRESIGTSC